MEIQKIMNGAVEATTTAEAIGASLTQPPTQKPVRLKMSEFLKSKLKVHRGRPRKSYATAKVAGLFKDVNGIEYSLLSNGMMVRTTPKKSKK